MANATYSSNARYNGGATYAQSQIAAGEFYADLAGVVLPSHTVDWNLQASGGTVWDHSITTSGVVTFTTGSSNVSAVPVLPAPNNTFWSPSISDAGLVTVTSGTSYTGQLWATFQDSNGVLWFWTTASGGVTTVSTDTAPLIRQRVVRLSTVVKYTGRGTAATEFRIYRVRPYVSIRAQLPDRYYALADVRGERVSVKVSHGGSEFIVSNLRALVKVTRTGTEGAEDS